jgi:hypothetical protein
MVEELIKNAGMAVTGKKPVAAGSGWAGKNVRVGLFA